MEKIELMEWKEELWNQFIEGRKYDKNVTPKTVIAYQCAWKATGKLLPDALERISEQSLAGVVTQMRKAGLSPISVDSYLTAINAFLLWLYKRGLLGHLKERVKIPKITRIPKRIPLLFTSEQIHRLVTAQPRGVNKRRAVVLVALLADSGLRITEALNLRRQHLEFDDQLIRVEQGKGQKDRMVPMSTPLRRLLHRWTAKQEGTNPFLFATRGGMPFSVRNAQRDLVILCRSLQVSGPRLSPHTLRASFATGWHEVASTCADAVPSLNWDAVFP